jgi:hypothetical protein
MNMAAKKKSAKSNPAQVWIVVNVDAPGRTIIPASATSRRQAIDLVEDENEKVVGPYVLAERKRNG